MLGSVERQDKCTDIRDRVRDLGNEILDLKKDYLVGVDIQAEDFAGQRSEMIANVMLSYRAMEDARMRIGKIMQQMQGGESIFDKPEHKKTEAQS